MQSRASRLARGWMVGTVATLVAAISHDLGGGDFPGWLALLVGTVFAGTVGTLLIGRRRSLPRLVAVVGIGQVAFHIGFSQLGAPTPAVPTHLHGDAVLSAGQLGADQLAHAAHLTTPAMIVGHVLAGVLAIVALRAAEGAVLRMLAEQARVVVRLLVAAPVVPVRPAVTRILAVDLHPVALVARRVLAQLPRRGPPRPAFA